MPKAPQQPIPSDRAPLDAELIHTAVTAYELEEPLSEIIFGVHLLRFS